MLGQPGYWEQHWGTLASSLVHQGTLYSATAPALMVLGRLAAAGSLEAVRRRDVCLLLLMAAGQLQEDMIADTGRALAEDRKPQSQRWAAPVREAIAAITPCLLARWDAEPSACRLVLAGLAAEFPEHGAAAVGKITQEADEYRGTQTGEHLMLAQYLISGETTTALAAAMAITCWNNDEILADWIDDDTIAPALRAIQILSETTPAAARRTSRLASMGQGAGWFTDHSGARFRPGSSSDQPSHGRAPARCITAASPSTAKSRNPSPRPPRMRKPSNSRLTLNAGG